MKSEYEQAWDDTTFTVYMDGDEHCMKLACCDCSLVHKFFIKATGKDSLTVRAERDNRATGQLRRHSDKPTAAQMLRLLSAAEFIIDGLILYAPPKVAIKTCKWLQDYKELTRSDTPKP